MRLIDADSFKEYCQKGFNLAKDLENTCKWRYELAKQLTEDFCKDIDEQPTVEAIPVIHAKWIKEKHRKNEMTSRTCSNCGMSEGGTTIKGNYCWYCGAKMDKEIEDVKN